MMRILAISDKINLPRLVAAAKSLNPKELVVITSAEANVPADKLIIAKLGDGLNECWVKLVEEQLDGYDLTMMPSTRNFKEIAARIAARKEIPYLSEVLDVRLEEGIVVSRMIFSGRGIEVLKTQLPAILTLNLDPYEPLEGQPSSVEELEFNCSPQVKLLERREKEAEVDLTKAEVIVSVGRGLKKKEDLGIIRELASLLGAEVACTRPISADFKWLPEERHVGMTGVRVKPKVYLALGISGQIQHVVGFRDAETVVAVNIDPEAPISEVSDYMIVGDLYEVVPKLIEEIKRRKS